MLGNILCYQVEVNQLVDYVYLMFMVFIMVYVIDFQFVMIIVVDMLVISVMNYFYYIIYFKLLIYMINGGKGNLSIG